MPYWRPSINYNIKAYLAIRKTASNKFEAFNIRCGTDILSILPILSLTHLEGGGDGVNCAKSDRPSSVSILLISRTAFSNPSSPNC
jgi:hypothetical protein